MSRRWSPSSSSCDGLEVWPHECVNTIDPCCPHESFAAAAVGAQVRAQCSEGNLESDVSPISEAVCHRLGGVGDCHLRALYHARLGAMRSRKPAGADHLEPGVGH